MSLALRFLVEAFRGAIQLSASILTAKGRRTVVLERRAKALRLFKELAAVGFVPVRLSDRKSIDG